MNQHTRVRSLLALSGRPEAFRAFILLLVLCAVFPTARSQESSDAEATEASAATDAADEPDEIFVDTIDVNLINVEVFVTDKDGDRIKGLTAADFELYEDGRPVTVSNFYAVEDGRPVSLPEPSAEDLATVQAELDPLEQLDTRLKTLPVPEDQRLHLVLYVDNLFIRPFNRNKVMRQVRQFLSTTITPQDRVMMVTYDRSVHVRHPFTSDMRAIATSLFDIEELTGWAVQADQERREFLRRIDEADTELEAEGHAAFYAESVYHDMTNSVGALKDLVGSLAGVPGRKAILYVSDGIPMTPGEDMFFVYDQRFKARVAGQLRANRYSGRRLFRELTARANSNRVTFYTLEAAGLRSHTSLSAEYGGSTDSESGLTGGSRVEADYMRFANYQEPLQAMADDTGGLAAFNTNNFAGALDRMAGDFQNFYSLGYVPARGSDGRFHDIEVKVKRKGLVVRHRRGYRDKTAETVVSEGTLAALLYGVEANPLKVTLTLKPERVRDEGHYLVPLSVRVPLGELVLIPQENQYLGRFRVSVAVIDDDGKLSAVEQHSIPLTIQEGEIEVAKKQYFSYEAELLMRRGQQQIAVGVRDEFAGETSFVRQSVRIGR